MTDPQLDYTKNEIRKNLILLENHNKNYPCPDCMSKHSLAVEGLSEEAITMTDNDQEKLKFLDIAANMRDMRKKMEIDNFS